MLYRGFMDAGISIFPLYRFDQKNHCECGDEDCPAVGKHPRASNWQHTPLWSEEQVENMEEAGHFATGYGVLCRGLLVVDVDARNGGIESYGRLLEQFPEIAGAGLSVMTGSGGGSRHLYFAMPDAVSLLSSLKDYPGIDFKSSGYVVGPGSRHASGGVYTADGEPCEIAPAPSGLVDLLCRPERVRTDYNGQSIDVTHDDIEDMLHHVANDDLDYESWIRVGMAIHQATHGAGYDLWERWSAKSPKHDEKHMPYKWHSFGRAANPVTIGTLIYHAEQGGWLMPVTFSPDVQFDFSEGEHDGLPFDISGVDLKIPPGFVGKIAKWIENQSRRPRENIAVAAALTAIGNIAGLRYIDEFDGVTGNLFTFCVAGSRTGKESIQQSVTMLHRAAGIAPATHGAIKSEQEIVKNLTRHQAAFYVIDEIGIFLQKVKNAQQRGGASYLDGVIGMLMAAYSKADGYLLLTGDAKEEIRSGLLKELSQLSKQADASGETPRLLSRMASISTMLENIDQGLQRPFLSLMGFTTPITFDELVDFQSATNGFIGRSLLFNERDTAPRSKPGFVKTPLPASYEAILLHLAHGGECDLQGASRVEYYGERLAVPSDQMAANMLESALEWFEDQAIAHKGKTGLESLYLGAYELMAKVSFILAVAEGIRTGEHVRWAFALVRRDIEEKIRLVTANDRVKDAPSLALRAKIANVIDGDGETIGVIYNRLRSNRREDVKAELEKMVNDGIVLMEITVSPRSKIKTEKYRLVC